MSDRPSAELRARILGTAAEQPALTRAQHRRHVMTVAALGALATAALFFVMGGVQRGARPAEVVAFTGGLGAFAAIALTRGSGPVSVLGPPRHMLLLVGLLTTPALALVVLLAYTLWPVPPVHSVGPSSHVGCAAITVAQGGIPLLAFLIPRRGTDPVHPLLTGASLGVTAGAWSSMLAHLRCGHPGSEHALAAHVLPVVFLALVGALLGRRLLSLRPS